MTFMPPEHNKTQEPFIVWNVSSAHESSSSNQQQYCQRKIAVLLQFSEQIVALLLHGLWGQDLTEC